MTNFTVASYSEIVSRLKQTHELSGFDEMPWGDRFSR